MLVAMRAPRGKLAPGAVAALTRTRVKDRRMKARATSKSSRAGLNPMPRAAFFDTGDANSAHSR